MFRPSYATCLLAVLVSAGCASQPPQGITQKQFDQIQVGMDFTEVHRKLNYDVNFEDSIFAGTDTYWAGPKGESYNGLEIYTIRWGDPTHRAAVYYKHHKVLAKAIVSAYPLSGNPFKASRR